MSARKILLQTLFAGLIASLLICIFEFTAKGTPPSGLSFTPVGRATVPEFRVKRKDKALDWEMELEADQYD